MRRGTFYYSGPDGNGIVETDRSFCTLFPNPVSENLYFTFSGNYKQATFELFDIKGTKLISKIISSGDTEDMQALSSGIYFYTISANNEVQRGKLIKN